MTTLHLFVGEEDLLIEEGVDALIAQTLPPESRALNLDVVNAGSTPVADLITRLDTLPFFGDRRVVVGRREPGVRLGCARPRHSLAP